MSQVCILTDSTAQFPTPNFPGLELVSVVPINVQLGSHVFHDSRDFKVADLPTSLSHHPRPAALPPSEETFRQIFQGLARKHNEIVALLLSSQLNPACLNAEKAAVGLRGQASVHVIDSQTTAVGLGLLVQAAAAAALQGASSARISRLVRGIVPHIYTVFCLQSLTYLVNSKHLDPAQAVVGEMLGVTPFFILENGRLVPIQKIRNARHLLDMLYEFITEFDDLQHIAFIEGNPPFEVEPHNLKERINGNFPGASISEHSLGTALAAILGPRSLGLVAMENCLNLHLDV